MNYYTNKKDILHFLKTDDSETIGIDIETTYRERFKEHPQAGLNPACSRIRLIQVFDGKNITVLDCFQNGNGSDYLLKDIEVVTALRDYLLERNLIAHNAAFESAHFNRVFTAHFDTPSILNIACTEILYSFLVHAENPEPKTVKTGLQFVAKKVLGVDVDKTEQTSDWSAPTLTTSQLEYAALDAILAYQIFFKLHPILKDWGMTEVYKLNIRALNVTSLMKVYGTAIDRPAHNALIEGWDKELAIYDKECRGVLNGHLETMPLVTVHEFLLQKIVAKYKDNVYGIILVFVTEGFYEDLSVLEDMRNYLESRLDEDEDKGTLRAIKRVIKNIDELLVSPNSGTQVSNYLKMNLDQDTLKEWPRTKEGHLKTNKEAFLDFAYVPEVAPIAKYKKFAKMISTYGRSLQEFLVDEVDGVTYLHGDYRLGNTTTGRMSSSNPNMQTSPRDEKFRSIFIPRGKDRTFIVADFNMIEVRVQAEYSQDEVMLHALRNSIDLHKLIGSRIANIPYEEVTKEMRQLYKNVTFGMGYGAGPPTLRKQIKMATGIDIGEQRSELSVDQYRKLYYGLRAWQVKVSKDAKKTLEVTTKLNKIRRLPHDKYYNNSMNHPIQGTAAEILLFSLIYLLEKILTEGLDVLIIASVHDEIQLDSSLEDAERAKKILEESMVEGYLTIFPKGVIKGLVDAHSGENWAKAKP